MAESVAEQKKRFPLALYNFRVTVDETLISFTEVSGIAVNYEHVTYRHGLSFLEGEKIQTLNRDQFVTVSCKRGTILGNSPTFLYDWLVKRDMRSVVVSLCDEKGDPVLTWKIAAAVPISLKAPSFSTSTNEVSIDTLDLQARGISVAKV